MKNQKFQCESRCFKMEEMIQGVFSTFHCECVNSTRALFDRTRSKAAAGVIFLYLTWRKLRTTTITWITLDTS